MTDEQDDFEVGIDCNGNVVIWIDGFSVPIWDPYDEAEADPVEAEAEHIEVDSRGRGVEWRDAYGDDQLRTSARYDETHPQVETQDRPPGLGASLLRFPRSLSLFITRRRRRRV